MGDLPEEFDCTITNWEFVDGLRREVSEEVRRDEFEPDYVDERLEIWT